MEEGEKSECCVIAPLHNVEVSQNESHTYLTLKISSSVIRHFPGLAQSISAVSALHERSPRDQDTILPRMNWNAAKKNRPIQLKSTHKLSQLTFSSFGDISAMRAVKGALIAQRSKEREDAAEGRPKLTATSQTPLQRAEYKLGKCSMIYDKRRMNDDLAGFSDGPPLTYDEFHTQLRRCLNINLTREEFEALFDHMDMDGNKVIDAVEFVRYFFKVGSEYHSRIKAREERVRKKEERQLEMKKEADMIKQQQKEKGVISSYTQEDIDKAMMKLCEKSFYFDAGNFINAVLVKYFKCHLTPYEFKMQLEKSFDFKVTSAELGALVQRFTRTNDQSRVDGEGFLNEFLALHHYEVERRQILKGERFYMKHLLAEQARKLDAQLFPRALGR